MVETPAERVFKEDQVNILFADGFKSRIKDFDIVGVKSKVVCLTSVQETADLVSKLAGPGVYDVLMLPGWMDDFEDWKVICDAVRTMDVPPRAVFLHCYDPDRAHQMMRRIRKDRPDILIAHIPWNHEDASVHDVKSTGVKYR